MADKFTFARPYAKALFQHATAHQTLSEWSSFLKNLSLFFVSEDVTSILANPSILWAKKVDFLLSLVPQNQLIEAFSRAFLNILAANGRLFILPEVTSLYESLLRASQNTKRVKLHVSHSLTKKQEEALHQMIALRLSSQIVLDIVVEPSLVGGAYIQAEGLVIDASISGALNRLHSYVTM